MCIYSLLLSARMKDAIQLGCCNLKLYMHICISYSFVGFHGTKCLLIDTFIYYIAMHNTVYKSSRLPVSAFMQPSSDLYTTQNLQKEPYNSPCICLGKRFHSLCKNVMEAVENGVKLDEKTTVY